MTREPVREKTLRQLQELIQTNATPGYRLPSERELAEQFGVSRTSVREALRSLTNTGLLETRPRARTRIAKDDQPLLETAFAALLRRAQPSLMDLYETRELLEVYLAGRAAERHTSAEIAAVAAALQEMGDGQANPIDHGPNLRFHSAIAAAAHNPILSEVLSGLYIGIQAQVKDAGLTVGDWPVSREIHEQIFEAIRRRNTQDAQRAMTMHMGLAIEEIRQIESQTKSKTQTKSEAQIK